MSVDGLLYVFLTRQGFFILIILVLVRGFLDGCPSQPSRGKSAVCGVPSTDVFGDSEAGAAGVLRGAAVPRRVCFSVDR